MSEFIDIKKNNVKAYKINYNIINSKLIIFLRISGEVKKTIGLFLHFCFIFDIES